MRLQILLLSIAIAVLLERQCSAEEPATTTTTTSTTTTTTTTRRTTRTTEGWDWNKNYLDSSEDQYKSNRRSNYRDRNDYSDAGKNSYKDKYDDDGYERKPSYKDNDEYNNDRKYSDEDENGYGYGDDDDNDYRPSKYDGPKKPDSLGHMNVYFREPSKDGKRKKPKRFRFPVARYERHRFPRSFGPLISFLPWLPIFADRLTKQTVIYSPAGGVYILPPLINFYGKRFSVAELIASGYASLVSSGVPPPPAVNVAPLVQPGAVVGPGVPTVNPSTGGFQGGVRTQFRSFPRPNYPNNIEERTVYPQQDNYDRPRTGY